MTRYAQNTSVNADRSRAEIERSLTRFGATRFAYGWEGTRAAIGFTIADRTVRITLPLPDRDDPEVRLTPTGRPRTAAQASAAYDQEVRRRWRALAAVLKAKLVAVSEGISTIEREFLADVVLPNGMTFAEWAEPQLTSGGAMPPLLPTARELGR